MNRPFQYWAAFTRRWQIIALSLVLLIALLAPLNLLATRPFHHDEALYATWSRQIASGTNPWLIHVPIDKPPLFLYATAAMMSFFGPTETAARLPSFISTAFIVILVFRLGSHLYTPTTGLVAAYLTALSPIIISLAPTALTDPLLVALALAGCLAAAQGKGIWAGVWLGLASATKQQGLLFAPLVLGLFLISPSRPKFKEIFSLILASTLTFLPALLWDWSRDQTPGFWQLSVQNYGGLSASIADLNERWQGFADLLYYATASSTLNIIFLAGLPLLLTYGAGVIFGRYFGVGVPQQPAPQPSPTGKKSKTSPPLGGIEGRVSTPEPAGEEVLAPPSARGRLGGGRASPYLDNSTSWEPLPSSSLAASKTDWLLTLFSLAFLLGHVLLSFQVWDRYLLGLVPLLALLFARVLLLPWNLLARHLSVPSRTWVGGGFGLGLSLLLAFTLVGPAQNAANGRYPLGSNSAALQGIEQITAYLRGNVGANHTLYHHWLGTHWRFYLWNYPYDLQYWASPTALADKAQVGHLIAFPTWRSDTEARLALGEVGLGLREVIRAYNPAGQPSIILYEIEARP